MRSLIIVAAVVFFPASAFAAEGSLLVFPSTGSYDVGETFEVTVVADTDGAPITAAEGVLTFTPGTFEVLAVSTAQSALALWAEEPNFSNSAGTVSFSGWAAEPFVSRNARLLTLTVRAQVNGEHTLRFTSGALLAHDGKGSNIVTTLGSGRYSAELKAAVSAGGGQVLGASTEDPDAPPPRPVLSEYPTDATEGDQAIVRGKALPDAKVAVWLRRDRAEAVEESVESTADGSFVFVSKNRLEAGEYELWAETYSERGVLGPTSGTVSFTVSPRSPSLVAAAIAFGTGPTASTSLLLAVGFGVGYALYLYLDRGRSRRYLSSSETR